MPILKFLAGFISNATIQPIRCAWNLASFICLMAATTALTTLAILQFAGGGISHGLATSRKSWKTLKASIKCLCLATAQATGVMTCASPLLRAAQACTEKTRPCGLFMPCDKGRSTIQRALGLNSWENPHKEPTTTKPTENQKIRIAQGTRPNPTPPENQNIRIAENTQPKKAKKQIASKRDIEWISLAEQYLKAKTIQEMDSIRLKMIVRHPANYARVLTAARVKAGRQRQKKHARAV